MNGTSAAKANAVHTHAESDVTNLTTDLAGKAASVHTHAESDVTGLVTDLAAKAAKAGDTFTGTLRVGGDLYDPSKAVSIVTNAPGSARQGSIVPNSGDPYNGLIEEGKNYPLGGVKHRFNNFGPRIGFAYDATGDGKTALRGGFGTFYERIRQNNAYFGGVGNPPVLVTPNLYGGNVDNLSPALLAGGTLFPASLTTINRNGKIPTIYSWSLGIQRELGARTSIDISYTGNTTRQLEYQRNIGQIPLGQAFVVLPTVNNVSNAARPFKGFTDITLVDFGANSNYHGLQARVSRRFASRLTANASFVWSRSTDQADTDGTTIGYYLDRKREWGLAGFDRTRTLTFDYVYQLPDFVKSGNAFVKNVANGWEFSGVSRFWDGTPITITSNGNAGVLSGGGIRADYLGGSPYATSDVKAQLAAAKLTHPELQYINPLAFGRPVDGSLGNLGRNNLRGPGINQWDISLFKNFKFTEKVNAQLRLETFNILNHTQFVNPGSVNVGSSNAGQPLSIQAGNIGTFGQFTDTRDPRNVQLGLKIAF